jgi:hypothetical protein
VGRIAQVVPVSSGAVPPGHPLRPRSPLIPVIRTKYEKKKRKTKKWPVLILVSFSLFHSALCADQDKIEKEWGSSIMWSNPPKPARFGYYNLVYPALHKYQAKFGAYPIRLDSLTKLDSVDYSHMERAWHLNYHQEKDGLSYSTDEFSEHQIDSLEQVKKMK